MATAAGMPVQTAIDDAAKTITTLSSKSKLDGEPKAVRPTPSTNGQGPPTGAEVKKVPTGKVQRASNLLPEVMSSLESLIMSDEWIYQLSSQTGAKFDPKKIEKPPEKVVEGPNLDELGRSILTSYSLLAYVKLLQPQHKLALANYIYQLTLDALLKTFRLSEMTLFVHEEKFDGLIRVIRLALHSAFPDFGTKGTAVLTGGNPAVYVSPALPYSGLERFLNFEFGFLTVRVVTSEQKDVALESLEVERLREAVGRDRKEGLHPLLVLGSAGSPLAGQKDELDGLRKYCEAESLWLHLEGYGLADLCLHDDVPSKPPAQKSVMQSAGSIFLPLGYWLGVPAVPNITLHKTRESLPPSHSERMAALPWWIVTRHLGPTGLRNRIRRAAHLAEGVLGVLRKYAPRVNVIRLKASQQQRADEGSESAEFLVTFRYVASPELLQHEKDGSLSRQDHSYLDSVNTWLGQGLCQECPEMGLSNVRVGTRGLCVRVCPLETANVLGTDDKALVKFAQQLHNSLDILDATLKARATLPSVVAKYPVLKPAVVDKWAGVGAVIYIPSMHRGTGIDSLVEQQRQQVSHLNIELVHELRANDTAFSVGQAESGVSCVKFGMLADEADLKHLIENVATAGQRLEESSQYIESLAQLVRQGIEAASEDLRKENEHKLIQEGVLRQVPVVGSLLNWWSPLPNTGMRGRAFDLLSGQIQSTESLYGRRCEGAGGHGPEELPPSDPHQPRPDDNEPHEDEERKDEEEGEGSENGSGDEEKKVEG